MDVKQGKIVVTLHVDKDDILQIAQKGQKAQIDQEDSESLYHFKMGINSLVTEKIDLLSGDSMALREVIDEDSSVLVRYTFGIDTATKGVGISIPLKQDPNESKKSYLQFAIGNTYNDSEKSDRDRVYVTTQCRTVSQRGPLKPVRSVCPVDVTMLNRTYDSESFYWIDFSKAFLCRIFLKKEDKESLYRELEIHVFYPRKFYRFLDKTHYDQLNNKLKNVKTTELSSLSEPKDSKKPKDPHAFIYMIEEHDVNEIFAEFNDGEKQDPRIIAKHLALPILPYGYVAFEIFDFKKLNFAPLQPGPGVISKNFLLKGGMLEYCPMVNKGDPVSLHNLEFKKLNWDSNSEYLMTITHYYDSQFSLKEDSESCMFDKNNSAVKANNAFLANKLYLADDGASNKCGFWSLPYIIIEEGVLNGRKVKYSDYSNIMYGVQNGDKISMYLLLKEMVTKEVTYSARDRQLYLARDSRKVFDVTISKIDSNENPVNG